MHPTPASSQFSMWASTGVASFFPPSLCRFSLVWRLSFEVEDTCLTTMAWAHPCLGEQGFKPPALSAFQLFSHSSASQAKQSCWAALASSNPSSPKHRFYSLLHFYFKFKRRNKGRKKNYDVSWCYFHHLQFLFFCSLGLPHALGTRGISSACVQSPSLP